MRQFVKSVEALSQWSARVLRWLCLVLVLVLVFEVVMRHVFDAPTIWAHMLSTMLGGAIAALGWAYTHSIQGHVRVDVFYTKYPPRVAAIVDTVCWVVVFLPLMSALIMQAARATIFAWQMNEIMIASYWYPPAWPIKTVVFLGLCLFALQGLATFVRDAYFALKGEPLV